MTGSQEVMGSIPTVSTITRVTQQNLVSSETRFLLYAMLIARFVVNRSRFAPSYISAQEMMSVYWGIHDSLPFLVSGLGSVSCAAGTQILCLQYRVFSCQSITNAPFTYRSWETVLTGTITPFSSKKSGACSLLWCLIFSSSAICRTVSPSCSQRWRHWRPEKFS